MVRRRLDPLPTVLVLLLLAFIALFSVQYVSLKGLRTTLYHRCQQIQAKTDADDAFRQREITAFRLLAESLPEPRRSTYAQLADSAQQAVDARVRTDCSMYR